MRRASLCLIPALILALALRWAAAVETDALGSLAQRLVETPSPESRAALVRFAAEQAGKASPSAQREAALARLVLGIQSYQDKELAPAVEQLELASKPPSELDDYAVYYRALALAASGDHAGAAALLSDFAQRFASSPLVASALKQRAESLSLSSQAPEALELLSKAPGSTAPALLLLAQVAVRAGEAVRAAQLYQRVYYEFPASNEQAQAFEALETLRARLGAKYPEASPALRLLRADRLAAAQKYAQARGEYRLLWLRLKGLPGEQAAVRVGVCDYRLKADTRAYKFLKGLAVKQPEAQAERLHFLATLCRRLKRLDESATLIDELAEKHPQSRWREEALYNAASFYWVENDPAHYIPYFQKLLEAFPKSRYGASAHWKIAWHAYVEKSPEAAALIEEHVRRFPNSALFTDAIYWLGRLAEARSAWADAYAIYTRLIADYPQYYHSLLAEDRMRDPQFDDIRLKDNRAPGAGPKQTRLDGAKPAANAVPGPGVSALVTALLNALPPVPTLPQIEPPADWKDNLNRVRLLDRLGFKDLADRELRFRADSPRFAYQAGFDLADRAGQRGSYHQAIRYLKHYTPGYLAFRLDAMPRRYWELLFPMPWRDEIESYSRQNNLDPYLVAALIRQESEFNPGAVSRAHALGLMQIMPATSRKLSRSLGVPAPPVNRLYVPQTSLQLGTFYLRNVLDQYDGRIEPALAGYNAGEHRADRWLGWHSLDDPAQFVESIPFAETRDYVESVLRNAEIYRRIYGGG